MSSSVPQPTPKVTAIVSTFASARFIRGCLEDLVAQSLYAKGELEILVIDSGSPENESEIVEEYQRRHPNIRLERTAREPLYAAWNRAIALASGEYITNANTDDRHRSDALELLANHLDANPETSVVYADCLVTAEANETWDSNTATERLGWPPFTYDELQRRCIVGPQPMWRRSLHNKWGPFDTRFRVAGDYEFWLRIGRSERIERYPATLGLYYRNLNGLEYSSGTTPAETAEIQRRYMSPSRDSARGAAAPVTPLSATAGGRSSAKQKAPDPLISVIIPTFNRPDFLARALRTLTEQTFKDFEVVVVNDCGDPLEPLLKVFEGQLKVTYIRHAMNRDRAAARNTGIRASRSKYIAYLDDDDGYRPDHLAFLVAALRAQGGCVAYSEAEWVEEVKTATGYQAVKTSLERDPSFNRDRLMVMNYIPILSVMHERACVDEVGLFDEDLGTHEDWDLFIRLADRYRFVHVPAVTADVSLRSDGTSTTSANRGDFVRTLKLIYARYHHLVAHRADIVAAQKRVVVSGAPAPEVAAEAEVRVGLIG